MESQEEETECPICKMQGKLCISHRRERALCISCENLRKDSLFCIEHKKKHIDSLAQAVGGLHKSPFEMKISEETNFVAVKNVIAFHGGTLKQALTKNPDLVPDVPFFVSDIQTANKYRIKGGVVAVLITSAKLFHLNKRRNVENWMKELYKHADENQEVFRALRETTKLEYDPDSEKAKGEFNRKTKGKEDKIIASALGRYGFDGYIGLPMIKGLQHPEIALVNRECFVCIAYEHRGKWVHLKPSGGTKRKLEGSEDRTASPFEVKAPSETLTTERETGSPKTLKRLKGPTSGESEASSRPK